MSEQGIPAGYYQNALRDGSKMDPITPQFGLIAEDGLVPCESEESLTAAIKERVEQGQTYFLGYFRTEAFELQGDVTDDAEFSKVTAEEEGANAFMVVKTTGVELWAEGELVQVTPHE